jgi:predicted glycosyl hydrolase (DUF1957 family)
LTNRTTAPYAARRYKRHLGNFEALRAALHGGYVDETWLASLEAWTPIFPELDVGAWR